MPNYFPGFSWTISVAKIMAFILLISLQLLIADLISWTAN